MKGKLIGIGVLLLVALILFGCIQSNNNSPSTQNQSTLPTNTTNDLTASTSQTSSGAMAAFTYSIDQTNQQVDLADDSTPPQNGTITGWQWLINGNPASVSQNYDYPVGEMVDLNVCLTITASDNSELTSCQQFNTGTFDVIDQNIDYTTLTDTSAPPIQTSSTTIAAFTYLVNPAEIEVDLSDTSTTIPGGDIMTWDWFVNGEEISMSQDYNYIVGPSTDLNVCLTVTASDNSTSLSCQQFNTGEWDMPQ